MGNVGSFFLYKWMRTKNERSLTSEAQAMDYFCS